MSTDADAVLALAVGDPETLLADVRKLEETETLQYARGWLTLVAEELRTELQLALALAPRTTTTKATQWSATFVAALDDGSSGWTVALKAPSAATAAAAAADDDGEPPAHAGLLLHVAQQRAVLLVAAPADEPGLHRCLLLDFILLFLQHVADHFQIILGTWTIHAIVQVQRLHG